MILVRKTNEKGNQGVFLIQGGKIKPLKGDLTMSVTRPKDIAKLCDDTVHNRLKQVTYEIYDCVSCGWTSLVTPEDIHIINQNTSREDIQDALDSTKRKVRRWRT